MEIPINTAYEYISFLLRRFNSVNSGTPQPVFFRCWYN